MKKAILIRLLCVAVAMSCSLTVYAQESPKISGFLQTYYSADDNELNNNTFGIKRARLSLSGNLFKEDQKKVDYRLQVDFANSPMIVDLWLKYAFNDHFGIQFGQAKTPLSYENSEYAPVKLQFIEYSLAVKKFAMNGNTGRELGIQAYGKFFAKDGYSILTYQAGVFNGNGINTTDNNQGKDFIGRIMVNPLKELTLSAYNLSRMGQESSTNKFSRTGFGANYDSDHFFARAEYIFGYAFGSNQDGAYALGGYKFSKDLSLGVRYDYYCANLDGKAKSDHITAGLSYYPVKNLRMQLDYSYKIETNNLGNKTNNNSVALQATIIY